MNELEKGVWTEALYSANAQRCELSLMDLWSTLKALMQDKVVVWGGWPGPEGAEPRVGAQPRAIQPQLAGRQGARQEGPGDGPQKDNPMT